MNNVFVFVVCGSKEHIDTLHFSLRYLKHFSKNEIIVLTDSLRNEISIEHENIIDVNTPEFFTHHQASIYLKTGIHKFLPKGNNYCYLDTDVVALNEDVDLIFNEFKAPITFAPDHCKVNEFSPYAVFCGCIEKWEAKRDIFEKASLKYDKNRKIKDPIILKEQRKLLAHFEELKKNLTKKALTAIRYFTSPKKFLLNNDFYFDKKRRVWISTKILKPVLYEVPIKKIKKETGFSYNKWTQKWLDENGEDFLEYKCKHLLQFINNKFSVKVNPNWQHWNGGVFLFNDLSIDFLTEWHEKTLEVFKDENWRTRDQGSLIVTANKFGLQDHPTLAKKWNFIADYFKKGVDFNEEGYFTDDNWHTKQKVNFIHIYHEWGNKDWPIWNWVLKRKEIFYENK